MTTRLRVSVLLLMGFVLGCSESGSKPKLDPAIEAQMAERKKAEAEGRMAPPPEPFADRNTNPNAYTINGGRRDDDPQPQVLAAEAFARDGSVTIEVTNINHVDNTAYCSQRLMEIAPPRGSQATSSGYTKTRVMIGGVSDINAFAKLIDFGEVTKIDDYLRIVYVKARDDRMPQILPKVSTKSDDPHFYRNNLVNLTHWHPTLRLNAIKELKKHLPEDAQLREKILQAIAIRATDVDRNVVMAATSDGDTASSSNASSQSGISFSFGNSAVQPEKLPARKQPETPLVETTVAGVVLEPKEILDGKVKLLMPKEFAVMSAEMLEVKYPAAQRPTLVFTNEKGTVNLAFNHTKNKATAALIPVFHRQMESMMKPQIAAENWLASELITLDELNWFRLDFRTPAVDTTIRNITLGTSLENRMLLVSFNTTTAEEAAWLPIGQQMIQSLQISR